MQDNLTPMMRQYLDAKKEVPSDALLLFRMGDFYEMFFEDAKRGSALMELTLTKRSEVPMCGFPYHALDAQLSKLIARNVKVAIADQMEDPKSAVGLVKRGITRVITPGTVVDNDALTPGRNNFLAALSVGRKGNWALAALDISTGDFKVTYGDKSDVLDSEFARLGAKECLIPEEIAAKWHNNECFGEIKKPDTVAPILWTELENYRFDPAINAESLQKHFGVVTLDGFGCRDNPLAISAAGAVLEYAVGNLRNPATHVMKLEVYHSGEAMQLDSISQRNLELLENRLGTRESTLLSVIDFSTTPMGGRLLREWILRPLCDKLQIIRRQEAVSSLLDDPLTLAELSESMRAIRDLERLVCKLTIGSANARDLRSLGAGLDALPGIKIMLRSFDAPMLEELDEAIGCFDELVKKIDECLVDEPPAPINEGGIIRPGFSGLLDELRNAATEGKNWLGDIQHREQERTSIKSLKVKYNQVFGYYIEISKSNLDMVPDDYIRKQTLVNAERFITPELKELEGKILGAEEKSKALELEIFQALRRQAMDYAGAIQQSSRAIARLDALMSLAEAARKYNYKRPAISEDEELTIVAGRHPVLDAAMGSQFVPNDVAMDGDKNRMMIITGPNMAGKSTYIRQTALLVVMAQMGSFIPAESARIGIVDRIFTRVGAADDLARGQSTFMVEMVETANILNNATNKSLVILDEIGRGTSTFDGLSIAWAVAEFLHDDAQSRCRTQFATHYHELTELAQTRRGVNNFNVAVREYGEEIIFLRRIVPGSSDRSYGIHVAKLAGLPEAVIKRAWEVLERLENHAGTPRDAVSKLPLSAVRSKSRRKNADNHTEEHEEDLFQPGLF